MIQILSVVFVFFVPFVPGEALIPYNPPSKPSRSTVPPFDSIDPREIPAYAVRRLPTISASRYQRCARG